MYYYKCIISDIPNPKDIKTIPQLIKNKEVEKVKYQSIKVLEPQDINYFTLSSLDLVLVEINKNKHFDNIYSTSVCKYFCDFWDFDKALQNSILIDRNNL